MIRNDEKTKQYRGQGIIEYILLIAAVIVALLFFLGKDGPFEKSYNGMIDTQGKDILKTSEAIFE